MPSDQDNAKKAHERYLADYFLAARSNVTTSALQILHADENPDFICSDDEGTLVGLEVAQVTRGPIDAFWARILDGQIELDPFDASSMIHSLIERKELARQERYSKKVHRCILMLTLVNSPLQRLFVALEGLQEDFSSHGFEEVWLVDYSDLDAYRNAELFGLYPAENWEHHERPNARTEPFG
jgi:hypothetical protein